MSDPDVLNTTVTGTNGTDGVAAVEPSTPGASAPAASWGGAGGTATNAVTGMASTTSSATLSAVGGNGGAPGATANAPGAQATFTSQYRYYQPGEIDATLVTATYGSGGSGGAGAYAGRGGNAAASVSASTFTNPFLTLELQAEAGAALNGANGGSGGSAGYNETDYRYGTYSGARVVTLSQTGGQGGLGGVGGRGGDGGSAGASLTNVSVSELPNSGGYIFIAATSEGTYGGTGGTGGAGGSGAVAGRSGDGGTGGKGGAGQVTVTGMSITQPGSGSVQFSLEAEGNNGGAGGDGGGASTGDTRINDVTGVTGTTTYGVAGAGGAGGNGGGATVTFTNNTIAAGSDIIISMGAEAGLGGQGGAGGTAGSSFTSDGVTFTAGTPGSAGANGRNGTGALAFTNNTLTASGTVELSFLINPPAPGASYYVPLNAAPGGNLAFYGNVLNGGGNGTLDLYAYGGSVIINSALGSVSVAGSAQNTMTGFTSFASFGAATFVIGGGADTYDAHAYGASSGDHFVIGRGHGNTVINGTGVYNDVQSTFEFRNYGAALSSYAQLLADAHGGRVVTTPDGSTITFDDNVSDLSAARFTFSNATPVTGALTLTAAGNSLSGSSIANTAITITSGAQIIGRTTANSTGKWSFAPSGLAAGVYSLTASETDSYGYVVSDVFGNVIVGPQITLTGGADTLSGSGGTSVIVAKAGALSAGDRITGTVTGSSLVLLGGGSFNLRGSHDHCRRADGRGPGRPGDRLADHHLAERPEPDAQDCRRYQRRCRAGDRRVRRRQQRHDRFRCRQRHPDARRGRDSELWQRPGHRPCLQRAAGECHDRRGQRQHAGHHRRRHGDPAVATSPASGQCVSPARPCSSPIAGWDWPSPEVPRAGTRSPWPTAARA